MRALLSSVAKNALKSGDHDENEDIRAVNWDEHVQRVRDVVSAPLLLHLCLLDLLNGLIRLVLKCCVAIAEAAQPIIALSGLHVPLLSNLLVSQHDLGTLIFARLNFELVLNQSLCQ